MSPGLIKSPSKCSVDAAGIDPSHGRLKAKDKQAGAFITLPDFSVLLPSPDIILCQC